MVVATGQMVWQRSRLVPVAVIDHELVSTPFHKRRLVDVAIQVVKGCQEICLGGGQNFGNPFFIAFVACSTENCSASKGDPLRRHSGNK